MKEISRNQELYQAYLTKLGFSDFESIKNRFEADKRHLANEILPLLPQDKSVRISELASGIGAFLAVLEDNHYSNFEGVDIGEEQIQIARKLGVKAIKNQDAFTFLENSNSLDAVVALDLLEHFKKAEAISLIKKAHASLVSGGKLILRCPNADSFGGQLFLNGDLTHELHLNSSSLAQLLRAGGFNFISIRPSFLNTQNSIKEILRRPLYALLKLSKRIQFFAFGLSSKQLILSPNILAVATKG